MCPQWWNAEHVFNQSAGLTMISDSMPLLDEAYCSDRSPFFPGEARQSRKLCTDLVVGTRVVGNIFAGADARADAVQIKTGPHTDPRTIHVENNRTANPELVVPPLAWQMHPATDLAIETAGGGWNLEGCFPYQHQLSGEQGASLSFRFYGSRVSILTSPFCCISQISLVLAEHGFWRTWCGCFSMINPPISGVEMSQLCT